MNQLEKKIRCYILVIIMYFTSTFGTLFMLFPYLPLIFINRRIFHVLSDFSLHAWFGNTVNIYICLLLHFSVLFQIIIK